MNTREYVDSLINNNNSEFKKENDKTNTKMNIFVGAAIASLVFAISGLTLSLPAGIAMIATSVAAISGYKKEKKRKKINEEIHKKRIKHLEDIKKNGIKIDKTSKIERLNKYRQAKTNFSGKEDHINSNSRLDNITNLITGVAGLAGFFLGGLTAIAAPILTGYKMLSNRVGNKDYEDYKNSKLEYDNLCDEYRILNYATNHRNNTRTTPTRMIPKKGKTKTYSKEQIEAADKYIAALEKINNEKEQPKKIVKK